MLNASPLLTFQLQGQTNGAAPNTWGTGSAISTVANISIYGDGKIVFTDLDGVVHQYSGKDSKINKLLELLIVGTGGLPAGTKLFGNA
jgi:hypothetical protein